MAKQDPIPQGSWLVAEELLESGDPRFVEELRRISDADRLGGFAATWFKDRRPASRRLLLEYLDQPLNSFRHEALVKRLFKAAWAANDDELMARFLVAFDRCLRRQRKTRNHYDWTTREQWQEEVIHIPRDTVMPRPVKGMRVNTATLQSYQSMVAKRAGKIRLFSISTRTYLRRRSWRYFRGIGRQDSARYLKALVPALALYTDEDCCDGLALIDNWSLLHVLFHHTDVLEAKPRGWGLRDGQSLGKLKPAPAFADAWKASAEPLIELLDSARSRTVRQWSIQMLREHHPTAMASLPLEKLLKWVCHADAELADLAAVALGQSAAVSQISVDRWLQLATDANPQVLDRVCDLIERTLSPTSVTLADRVQLACSRQMAVARLGQKWLQASQIESDQDARHLLRACDAPLEQIRKELVELVCRKLEGTPYFNSDRVLDVLDSRHEDVREAGWNWLTSNERFAGDITIWQRLMETPYDDLRLRLASLLERHAAQRPVELAIPESTTSTAVSIPAVAIPAVSIPAERLNTGLVRHLWATVLLNIHRGNRQKPGVVNGIVDRISRHPDEAPALLPLLGVSLRSVRSVEWRAALGGLLRLIELRPELTASVKEAFPELTLA